VKEEREEEEKEGEEEEERVFLENRGSLAPAANDRCTLDKTFFLEKKPSGFISESFLKNTLSSFVCSSDLLLLNSRLNCEIFLKTNNWKKVKGEK
jgi:hypothetical protein